MKRFIITLVAVLFATQSFAAILVYAPDGSYATKLTLEEARVSVSAANKTVVVTSALTQAQSNITGAWPADRALRVEKGGSINPSSTFPIYGGLLYAEAEWFGRNTIPNTTVMSTAINKAIASVVDGGEVVLPFGKSLITAKILVNKRVKLRGFSSTHVGNSRTYPSSTLVKSASLNDTAVDVARDGATAQDFYIEGLVGNGGDGIVAHANSLSLKNITVSKMGGVGVRVGDGTGTNTNSIKVDQVTSVENVSHGFYLHSSTVDANAGLYNLITAIGNGGDGVRVEKALGNTFIAPLTEINTGYGFNFLVGSSSNTVVGGDIQEANVAGSIKDAGSFNQFLGVNALTMDVASAIQNTAVTIEGANFPAINVIPAAADLGFISVWGQRSSNEGEKGSFVWKQKLAGNESWIGRLVAHAAFSGHYLEMQIGDWNNIKTTANPTMRFHRDYTLAVKPLAFYTNGAVADSQTTIIVESRGQVFHVSGTAAVVNITPPNANFIGQYTIIPDGAFTTTTAGNIGAVTGAIVGRALIMTYDGTKWWPSY